MGLHHHHEPDMISYSLSIALKYMSEIHKGISNLTRIVHHPGLLSLSKETFQTFAYNRTADIKYKIRDIFLIIPHDAYSFIEQRIHRLSAYQHRTRCRKKHPRNMTQRGRRHIGSSICYLSLSWQFVNTILEKRFGNRHVDVYGSTSHRCQKGLVHQTVTVPFLFRIMRLKQRHSLFNESPESIRLRQRLSI